MTDTLLDLSAMGADLRLEGHLVECAGPDVPWRECQWCHRAVSSPQIRRLLDARHDARALLGSDADGTVPWVTAAGELLRTTDAIDVRTIPVPSVRHLAERLRRVVTTDLERLRSRLRAAVAPGGPVERRCVRTAGALAATALHSAGRTVVADHVHPAVRTGLATVAASLPTDVQVAGLLPAVERRHWRPLPLLRTQPEWGSRRRGTWGTRGPVAHTAVTGVTRGSLEELVVESVIDRLTAALAELGDDLICAGPPVTLTRPVGSGIHSARTRARLWRIARIDWHLTFVDTGRAECWNARVDDGLTATDVPWPVAVAIDVAEAHGLISATHHDRPSRRDEFRAGGRYVLATSQEHPAGDDDPITTAR